LSHEFSEASAIYRPVGFSAGDGVLLVLSPAAHRLDESLPDYSSAGWSPPEPASASPDAVRMLYSGLAGRVICSERPTVSYSVVSAEGSTPHHAIVFRLGDVLKRYFIRDLESTCGTYVNGERLQAVSDREPVSELKNGDVISLWPSHINTFVFLSL
jgi:hypothetical protein